MKSSRGAKGAAACLQTNKELPPFSGATLDTAHVLREFSKSVLLACLFIWSAPPLFAAPASDPFAPLRAYDGTWRITQQSSANPEELKNQCQLIGKFFACQQTVNGQVSALLIFVPGNQPGHYATQSVNLEGRALGRGDLVISGNQWTFTNQWEQGGGKSTYYKTINTFTGRDHIHFEQQQSTNGRDYSVKNSGDETRVGAPR